MLWDTHMHTHFSGDSDADPKDMIQAAIEKNLSGICITDHLDYDYPNEPDLFLLDLNKYAETITALKEQYRQFFPVRFGIEIGVQPHLAEKHRAITAAYPFDFVIASSHTANGMDPYYKEYFDNVIQKDAYCRYFSCILQNITCFRDFDVYGHLDYVTRYGSSPTVAYTYPECRELIDEILTLLIRLGKGIELNTGGLRSDSGRENPHRDILMRYHELGGEIITIGSDAHTPEHVAWEFAQARQILRSCGFTHYCYYTDRKVNYVLL